MEQMTNQFVNWLAIMATHFENFIYPLINITNSMGYGEACDVENCIVADSLIRFWYCHSIPMEIKYRAYANLKQCPVTLS